MAILRELDNLQENFSRKIRDKREQVTEALSRGRAADYADYRQMVGLLQGLEFATNVMDDLALKAEQDEDEP